MYALDQEACCNPDAVESGLQPLKIVDKELAEYYD